MSDRTAYLLSMGAKLRKWLDSKGHTQGVAASHVGASQVAWSSWEAGTRAPDLHFAFELERLTDGGITAEDWAWPRPGVRSADATGPQQVVTAAALARIASG